MATLIDYILIPLDLKESKKMAMHEHVQLFRYQNVINQGGHPIALVSIGTTLCEKSLLNGTDENLF